MTVFYQEFGRINQKRRTWSALRAAAVQLLRDGRTPTVAEVADAALVSKTTAYRYFPSHEALIADAALVIATAPDLERVRTVANQPGGAVQRVQAVVRADQEMTLAHESAFRTALRYWVQSESTGPGGPPRRPGNRLQWFADALTPAAGRIHPDSAELLVPALSLCVGIESLVVLRDVCGLDAATAEAVKLWAARALLAAAVGAEDSQESGSYGERSRDHGSTGG